MRGTICRKEILRRVFAMLMAAAMILTFMPDMSMTVYADDSITVTEDTSSQYIPTKIVNGDFSVAPWMNFTFNGTEYLSFDNRNAQIANRSSAADKTPNGVGGGWNTTETQIYLGNLFEWSGTPGTFPHFSAGNAAAVREDGSVRYFVDMNCYNPDVLYQDLATQGGDIIRWTLMHAPSFGTGADDLQAMHVDIGAPDGDPSGKDSKIKSDSLGQYQPTGITSGLNSVAFANSEELSNLLVNKSEGENPQTAFKCCAGVYIVPNGQTVTRFAFVSDAPTQNMGNLLSDLTFSTLIGNLHATIQEDGSVNVTGYWGDSDNSRKLKVKIGNTVKEVDMSSVLNKNFLINIPESIINGSTFVEVYHQDYEAAKKSVNVEHEHKWSCTVGSGETANELIAKCTGAGECTVENGKTDGIRLKLTASNAEYLESDEYSGASFDNSDVFKAATGLTSDPKITYFKTDGENILSGGEEKSAGEVIKAAGFYYAKAEISGTVPGLPATVAVPFAVVKKAPSANDMTYTVPKSLVYDGNPKIAEVLAKDGITGLGTIDVKYYKDTTPVTSPADAGTYIVKADVAEGTNYSAAADLTDAWTFTVNKAVQTLRASDVTAFYGDTGKKIIATNDRTNGGTLSYEVTEGSDVIAVDADGNITIKKVGTATVKITAAETENYALTEKNITVTVKRLTPVIPPTADPIEPVPATPIPTETPVPTAVPAEEYPVPVESDKASVQVSAEIEDGIAAVDEITAESLKEISMNDDGTEDGGKPEGTADGNSSITIDFSKAKQKVEGVELSKKSVENLVDALNDENSNITSVIIRLKDASVELDAKTLETLRETMEGDSLKLVAEKTEKKELNDNQKDALSKYNVNKAFEAYFESNGKKICDFKDNKITVSINFTPGKGKNAENYKVYCVTEDGRLQKLATKYENGKLVFVTDYYSDFVVIYDPVQDVALTEAVTTGKGYIKLSWSEIEGAEKYVVYGAKFGKAYKKLTETEGTSLTVKKVSGAKPVAGKSYKFYVVAYDALGNKVKSKGIHYIAGNVSDKYANVETITAKEAAVTLTVGEKLTVGVEYTMYDNKKHLSKKHGAALRFISDCPEVAKVSKSGTVTAKGEGMAVICIQDITGKWCTVEVTVKK